MKRKAIVSLLLIPFLVGCFKSKNKKKDSSIENNASIRTDVKSSSTVEKTWTDEQLAVFLENLHGYVLPYYDLEGNDVFYSEEDSSIYIYGAQCTGKNLNAYCDLLKDDGWNLIHNEETWFFVYEKEINTENGARFLNVQVFAMDSKDDDFNTQGNGIFTVIMNDPYKYEWPADTVNACTEVLNPDTTTKIPAFIGASRYEVDFSDLDLGVFSIYCYTNDKIADSSYKTTLINNKFEVSSKPDADGFYRAVSVDKNIDLYFAYDSEYKCLEIDVYNHFSYSETWLGNELNQYINLITNYSDTVVPSYDEGYAYNLVTDYFDIYGYVTMFCYTKDADSAEKYVEKLKNLNYTVSETNPGIFSAISSNKDLLITVDYDADWQCLDLYFYDYVPALTEWPTEDIAEYLQLISPGTETVIPPYTEAGEYAIDFDYVLNELVIGCGGTDADKYAAYRANLEENGWFIEADELYESYYYFNMTSPDGKILINAYMERYDTLIMYVSEAKEPIEVPKWPEEEIENIVGLEGIIPCPETKGILSFDLSSNGNHYYVVCGIEEGKEQDAVREYYNLLDNMGFEFRETIAGVNYFDYVNKSYAVGAFTNSSGTFVIDFYYFEREKDEGEGKDFEEKFTNWTETCELDIAKPDFSKIQTPNTISDFEVETDREAASGVFFDCYFTPTKTEDLQTLFKDILECFKASGYSVPKLSDGQTYVGFKDPDEKVDVLVRITGERVFVEICEVKS